MELSLPAAKHPADPIELLGQGHVLFVVERVVFPQNEEQYFERVQFPDGVPDEREFFFFPQEGCRCDGLDRFDEQGVNP